MKLSGKARHVLLWVGEHPGCLYAELAAALQLHRTTVYGVVHWLVRRRLLRSSREPPTNLLRVWPSGAQALPAAVAVGSLDTDPPRVEAQHQAVDEPAP